MTKVKLTTMSHTDRETYQYYKRVLRDLTIYGPHYIKEVAERRTQRIESKYLKVKELEE